MVTKKLKIHFCGFKTITKNEKKFTLKKLPSNVPNQIIIFILMLTLSSACNETGNEVVNIQDLPVKLYHDLPPDAGPMEVYTKIGENLDNLNIEFDDIKNQVTTNISRGIDNEKHHSENSTNLNVLKGDFKKSMKELNDSISKLTKRDESLSKNLETIRKITNELHARLILLEEEDDNNKKLLTVLKQNHQTIREESRAMQVELSEVHKSYDKMIQAIFYIGACFLIGGFLAFLNRKVEFV